MSKNTLILTVIVLAIILAASYLLINSPQPSDVTQTATSTVSTSTASATSSQSTTATSSPSNSPATSTPVAVDGLQVTSPFVNQVITSPLQVKGRANGKWYFEGSFPVKLLDANKKVLARGIAKSQGDWATTTLTAFSLNLTFSTPTTQTGTLVFENDNPSGLPQNQRTFSIPVRFAVNTSNKVTIDLFYPNSAKATQVGDVCSSQSVVAVTRQIPRTITPVQDAIKLLLKGELTQNEKAAGFTTEFPLSGVQLKSANLKNGRLTVEFTDPNHQTTGGSCRVGLLKAQIEKTALQFAGVQEVVVIPATIFQP